MVTVREAAGQAGDTGPAVSVRGLTKSYADVPAVRGIDLEIGRGEIFALLGPNGPARPPLSRSWRDTGHATTARSACWVTTPAGSGGR